MESKWWSILGLCGLVVWLCKDGDKPAGSMSGIRKRKTRRLFFIYDGKTITRGQVNEAKRLARAGYGTLYATWAYSANEARGMIREGRAERLSGLGDFAPSYDNMFKSFAKAMNCAKKTKRNHYVLFAQSFYKDYNWYKGEEAKSLPKYIISSDESDFDPKTSHFIITPTGQIIEKQFLAHRNLWQVDEMILKPKSKRELSSLLKSSQCPLGTKPITLHGLSIPKVTDSLPPILGWLGGKTKLADKIISMMPPHKTYVEPFLGGGSVFFKKPLAETNVINDIDKELMGFYKGVRDGECEKIRACKLPKNRKEFDRAVENKSRDICSYLGVNKRSYGSKMNKTSFAIRTARARGDSIGAMKFRDSCNSHKDKLKQTEILNKDYKDVIKQYDSKNTLCYIDPPYVDTHGYKHDNISPEEVAKIAKSMKGKAIISYNNHPRVRKAFAGLKLHKVKTRYELQKSMTGTQKDVSELLITNF